MQPWLSKISRTGVRPTPWPVGLVLKKGGRAARRLLVGYRGCCRRRSDGEGRKQKYSGRRDRYGDQHACPSGHEPSLPAKPSLCLMRSTLASHRSSAWRVGESAGDPWRPKTPGDLRGHAHALGELSQAFRRNLPCAWSTALEPAVAAPCGVLATSCVGGEILLRKRVRGVRTPHRLVARTPHKISS